MNGNNEAVASTSRGSDGQDDSAEWQDSHPPTVYEMRTIDSEPTQCVIYEDQDSGNEEYNGTRKIISRNRQIQPSDSSQKMLRRPGYVNDVNKQLADFWPSMKRKYEEMTDNDVRSCVKHMELPMARVKKIMKIDDNVRMQMISQDAPLFLAAVSEMFIQELTLKSWKLVDDGKRKTLQKCDVACAIAKEEHFDFLIDIVPREDLRKSSEHHNPVEGGVVQGVDIPVQYYLTDADGSLSNTVYQIDDGAGRLLQATQIGQPIALGGSTEIDLSGLPPGIEIIQISQ